MKVLIACEESQRVCTAFRQIGHEAYSCDVQECSGGHPEWHIQGDVLPYIDGSCIVTTMDGVEHRIDGTWDLLIAHPPCTYLSNAGARHLWKVMYSIKRGTKKVWKARHFSCVFWVRIAQEFVSKIPSQAAYMSCLSTRRRYSRMSTGTHIAIGRVCGLKICRRYSRRTSWILWGHGARLAATAISTMPSIKGFLQKTEQKAGAKLFRGLQKRWQSNGEVR